MDNRNVTLGNKVAEVMNTWVLQMGFPVVTINTTTGQVSQRHFLLDPEAVVTTPSPYEYVHAHAHARTHARTQPAAAGRSFAGINGSFPSTG